MGWLTASGGGALEADPMEVGGGDPGSVKSGASWADLTAARRHRLSLPSPPTESGAHCALAAASGVRGLLAGGEWRERRRIRSSLHFPILFPADSGSSTTSPPPALTKGGKGIRVWGAVSTSYGVPNAAPCSVSLPKIAEGRVPLEENAHLSQEHARTQKVTAVSRGMARRHPLLMASYSFRKNK
ncbi:hypothetical protein OsI_31143 [Oryza sativa Indica Group]|uniref:Uncharacterized protein n=1 Tax=Oryza sativa subsp. indica TaxID=39946 RepID=B8BEZ1_ORYSI|nr:hypothetical protein OsI_31143 [Oryza sativa Indica Group]